ncbi:hypothetical protein HZH68_016141 [Vespula germanica]|uniref:Uncharacterized protein n=1 Tax=Vespula germanica TaxID=30212 RepID=A0A834J518_VESGE|nr:hypothetical protein HZH68_016141 [Vespula germanica]
MAYTVMKKAGYMAILAAETFMHMNQSDIYNTFDDVGIMLTICQYGFDNKANHLLSQNSLPAVKWVDNSSKELKLVQTACIFENVFIDCRKHLAREKMTKI